MIVPYAMQLFLTFNNNNSRSKVPTLHVSGSVNFSSFRLTLLFIVDVRMKFEERLVVRVVCRVVNGS